MRNGRHTLLDAVTDRLRGDIKDASRAIDDTLARLQVASVPACVAMSIAAEGVFRTLNDRQRVLVVSLLRASRAESPGDRSASADEFVAALAGAIR